MRPGSKYTVRGWLKGENIRGGAGAGYFLHIGPAGKEHLKPVNRWGNHGTFDWKPIEFSGVIPEDADSMIVGTVMHADAGRAWFDDVEVKLESPETLSAVIGKPEKSSGGPRPRRESGNCPLRSGRTVWSAPYSIPAGNLLRKSCA